MKFIFVSAEEGTALCNILSNRYNRWKSTLGGDILVNGVYVSPGKIIEIVIQVITFTIRIRITNTIYNIMTVPQ